MGSWVQSICDRCWELFQPGRTPTRLVEPEEEICGICGEKTLSGIYFRADPKLTPHPQEGEGMNGPRTATANQMLRLADQYWPDGPYYAGPEGLAIDLVTVEREERERIIEIIANVPVTIKFMEPVTEIDVFDYHADIIKAILKESR